MNAKWCVSTLIIIFAYLGLSREPSKASNQQILLQFTDLEIASENNHEDVLAAITYRLGILGIEAVEIIENDDRQQVSIRYYSDVDALSVKKFISQEKLTSSSIEDEIPLDFPKDKLPETYSLVVTDLQQQVDYGLKLNGNLVLNQKQDYITYFHPVVPHFNDSITLLENIIVIVKLNGTTAIAIDNTSKSIPEVRAGPFFYGIA